MKKILMYDTMYALMQYKNSEHADIKDFLELFGKKFTDYFTCIGDRSGAVEFPFKIHVPEDCKLPVYVDSNITYKEAALRRAQQLIAASGDKKINLMYSGGIDSSVVLTSFIDYLGVDQARDKLNIMMSNESIIENPWMWDKFIRPHFNVVNSKSFDLTRLDPNAIYLNGELNDQLYGNMILLKAVTELTQLTGKNLSEFIVDEEFMYDVFLRFAKLSPRAAAKWAQVFMKLMSTCPVQEKTYWTLTWWYGFACKWINVKYRIHTYNNIREDQYQLSSDQNDAVIPFFDSTDFQLWSMNNKEPKNLQTFDTYKWTAKRYVSDLLGEEYMAKLKKLSLDKVLAMKRRTQALDSDFMLYNAIDFMTFYSADNDFSDK
jgi:hypothetical protein